MKFAKKPLLATGLLAGALTFVGCASGTPAVRESPYGDNTGSGSGHISKTKQSDDNLRMPLEDPLRTRASESIMAAEIEPNIQEGEEPIVDIGFGGSGTTRKSQKQEDNCPRPEQKRSRVPQGSMNPEAEPSVHENSPLHPDSDTGGSGFGRDTRDESLYDDDTVREGDFRIPDSPADPITPEDRMIDEREIPDGSR